MKYLLLVLLLFSCEQKAKVERKELKDADYCVHGCVEELLKNSETKFLGGASASVSSNPIDNVVAYCKSFVSGKLCCDSGILVMGDWDARGHDCTKSLGFGVCLCEARKR